MDVPGPVMESALDLDGQTKSPLSGAGGFVGALLDLPNRLEDEGSRTTRGE